MKMNFFEAMTALQNGRKIRAIHWAKGNYIGLKEQQFKLFGLPKSEYTLWGSVNFPLCTMPLEDAMAMDWEELKEGG